MAFCTSCGNKINEGVKFCASCGKEQVAALANCSKCGKELEVNEKFCSGCGTPATSVAAPKKQVEQKPEEEKYTEEGRKIITGGPRPGQHSTPPPPPPEHSNTPKKKKKGCRGCALVSILILAALIVGTMALYNTVSDWWQSLDLQEQAENILDTDGVDGIVDIEEGDNSRTASSNNKIGIEIPVKINGKAISKETTSVSEKNTVANFKKVRIDFGQFILDKESKVSVEEYKQQIINSECSLVAYDIELKGKSKFDDYITIELPYNEQFIINGTAEQCVAAQYYNPKTKIWEPVLYEIDSKNKKVLIRTNHLSRYGVFTVKNATKRHAFITNVYIPDRYLLEDKTGMHLDILENYYENDKELGKEALNHGLSFWGKFSGRSGVAINTLTVGGSYSTEFIGKLNDGFKNLGYIASVVQLGYDLYYSEKEERNKTAAINLTKNIMNQLVAEFGTPAINVAFIGVYIFDITLNEFGNAMLAQKYKELWQVYDFYNRRYNPRSLKEWRALMIEIHKNNPKNPSAAYKEIMEEIEDYAWQFMETTKIGTDNENTAELNSLAGEAGLKRMAWPSKKDKNGIYEEGKKRIIDKLYPVFNSVNKWRLSNLKLELTKDACLLAKELNKKINLTIIEKTNKGKKANLGGYKVAIRPLEKGVDKAYWTGRLKDTGITKTSFTFIGHFTAGKPNKVEIYRPDDNPDIDEPIMVKKFVVDKSKEITIVLEETNETNLLPTLQRMKSCQIELFATIKGGTGESRDSRIVIDVNFLDNSSQLKWDGTNFSHNGSDNHKDALGDTQNCSWNLKGSMSRNGNLLERLNVEKVESSKYRISYPKNLSKKHRTFNTKTQISFSALPYVPYGKSGLPKSALSFQVSGKEARKYLSSFEYSEFGYNEDDGDFNKTYSSIDWTKPVRLMIFFHTYE